MVLEPMKTLPFPQDTETKSEFRARWDKHKSVLAAYPGVGARLAALERTWAKAKATSLVFVRGSQDEMVLFGSL